MSPFLSIIIPAYNEAKRLPPTLRDIDAEMRKENFAYEIIVVSDGSTDATVDEARRVAEDIPCLTLIDNKENRGKGAVVRQGMLAARGDIRLFTDADNSTSIKHFRAMCPYFEQGFGVVIGSRAVRGAVLDPPQPIFRRIAGKALNLVTQALLLPGIWDTQCGFKAFTAAAAQEIFAKARVNGWAFDVEALALAKALGFRVREIPVTWKNNAFSRVPLSAGLHFITENITIRCRLWADAYRIRAARKW
ncbi:MAG: glycosyltransferase family 2 protein [Candidatus Liptonbacteria bacterium]|nr:glycosyltransferase family 2 protein [Candidatus Liptonbacteria bacterium]